MVLGVGSSSEQRRVNGADVGEWLVNVAHDVVVPMTTSEVIEGLRSARLSEQSLVWRTGMQHWTSITDVRQLRLAAGSRLPPAAAPRMTRAPFPTPEGGRRGNTLPLGFPAVREPAPAQQPLDRSSPASLSAPWPSASAPRAGRETAPRTPASSVPAPLTAQPAVSTTAHSLVPTTAEADADDQVRASQTWTDLEELLVNERRADKKTARRVLLCAAAGVAALAAVFTLWLRPAPQEVEPMPARVAQASAPPMLAPTREASVAPGASAPPMLAPTRELSAAPSASAPAMLAATREISPAAGASVAKRTRARAPRFARRPKATRPAVAESAAPALPAALAATGASADVDDVPSAPAEPASAASASPDAAEPSSSYGL